MLAGILLDDLPIHSRFIRQDVQHRAIDSVIITIRVFTIFFSTANLLLKADFLLRRKGHRMQMESLGFHQAKSLFRSSPGCRTCSQVKHPFQ
ncbi:hypothetical protein D3C81_1301650 [compost metagenome]